MIKSLVRYVYEYYRSGGIYPWLATHISRMLLPISVYWTVYVLAVGMWTDVWIGIAIGTILTTIAVARFFIILAKHLSGMMAAMAVYKAAGVGTDIMSCTPWRDVADRLVDRGILDVNSSFGGEVESLSRSLVDISAMGLPTTALGITILRRSIHRSLRGAIPLRFSLFIEAVKEVMMYPINLLERLTDMIISIAPIVYSSPGELMRYTFRHTIVYEYRSAHEMHFEAEAYFDELTATANAFLSSFPSPFLDTLFRIVRVPLIILAGYLLYSRLFEALVFVVIIFGVINKTTTPGRLDPTATFEVVNRRFKAADAAILRDLLITGRTADHADRQGGQRGPLMRRKSTNIIYEVVAIFFAPFIALSMMRSSHEMYDVILRRMAIIDGEVGMCTSTRVYRHVTMMDDTRGGMTQSEMFMFDELGGLMERGVDV